MYTIIIMYLVSFLKLDIVHDWANIYARLFQRKLSAVSTVQPIVRRMRWISSTAGLTFAGEFELKHYAEAISYSSLGAREKG